MNKYFNVIPGNDTACILLYGDIDNCGECNSATVVRELLELQNSYNNIDVRINSNGGSVYAGIAIFNALKNSTANIRIYVDGVAASIASVIALCGKPLSMSKYARLMLHSVQGGAYGDKAELAEVIKGIESLEKTLSEIIAPRCGKTPEEVRSLYFDGEDHWLTAEQAKALGLIDDIYDTDPVPAESSTEQIYAIFNNRLNKPQHVDKMNLEELKKRPSFVNCATDEDVLKHIDTLEAEAGKVPALATEIDTLKQKNQEYENKAKEIEEAEITALVDAAVKDERIGEPQRPTYVALLKADKVNGEAALKALKPKRMVMNNLGAPAGEATSSWDARMNEIKNQLK